MEPQLEQSAVNWQKTEKALISYEKTTKEQNLWLKLETDEQGNRYLALKPKNEMSRADYLSSFFGKGNWGLKNITQFLLDNAQNIPTNAGQRDKTIDKALDKLSQAVTTYNTHTWACFGRTRKIKLERDENFKSLILKTGQAIQQIYKPPITEFDQAIIQNPRIRMTDEELVAFFYQAHKEQHAPQMTGAFFTLLFQNPKKALEILNDKTLKMESIVFDQDQYRVCVNYFASCGPHPHHDQEFALCIQALAINYSIDISAFHKVLDTAIRNDLPASCKALADALRNPKRSLAVHIGEKNPFFSAVEYDSLDCLKELVGLWPNAFPAVPGAEYTMNHLMRKAVECHSPLCLSFLVNTFGIEEDEKNTLVNDAVAHGYAELVFALCKDNAKETASFLFKDKTKVHITAILRFSPIALVDDLVQAHAEGLSPNEKQQFLNMYSECRATVLKALPFIARHTKFRILGSFQTTYASKEKGDAVAIDIKYGLSCHEQTKKLAERLLNGELVAPTKLPFTCLPPPSMVAALLEQIAEIRSILLQERRGNANISPDNDPELFSSLRESGFKTQVTEKYEWGDPLILSVLFAKDTQDLVRTPYGYDLCLGENGPVLTRVDVCGNFGLKNFGTWYHGRAPLATTWPRIEALFALLLKFDLSKDKPQYAERMAEFHKNVAEFAGLFGTTQPLKRGSGSACEWLIAIIYHVHHLDVPSLKTEFPQHDVLNISIALSLYMKSYTYFRDQATLPKEVRRARLPGSVPKQLRALLS